MTIHSWERRGWPHKSDEDLARAGFKSRGTMKCPFCYALVNIYQVPGEMPVFLDPESYYPHLDPQHADPPEMPVDGKSAAAGER
jgi:hypothetical protein